MIIILTYHGDGSGEPQIHFTPTGYGEREALAKVLRDECGGMCKKARVFILDTLDRRPVEVMLDGKPAVIELASAERREVGP